MEKALEIKQQTSNDLATGKNLAITLSKIGQSLIAMNKLSDAKEYLENAIEYKQQASNNLFFEKCVASTVFSRP